MSTKVASDLALSMTALKRQTSGLFIIRKSAESNRRANMGNPRFNLPYIVYTDCSLLTYNEIVYICFRISSVSRLSYSFGESSY